MGGQSSSTQTQQSTTAPWTQAQPDPSPLQDSRGRRARRRDSRYAGGTASIDVLRRCTASGFRFRSLVAGFSRGDPGCVRRRGALDARPQRRIYLSRRRTEKTLRPSTATAPDARDGIAGTAQWLELHGFGYHRQSSLSQQLYPRRLSAVPPALSMGVSGYAVLAQGHRVSMVSGRAGRAVLAFFMAPIQKGCSPLRF